MTNSTHCKSILGLFRAVLTEDPKRIAVEATLGEFLTYQELDFNSSIVASRLRNEGVLDGQVVPLFTSSCLHMVVGVLGILKAGAIYVPLDREMWPQNKIQYVLQRTNAAVVLYTGDRPVIKMESAKWIGVEDIALNANYPWVEDVDETNACQIMCIIYTSGTTNHPKGVMVRHSSVIQFVTSSPFNFNVLSRDRLLLFLSVAFDACMGALFSTLCNGGTVAIANKMNFQERARNASIIVATPSVLAALPSPQSSTDYPELTSVILGGETASQQLLSAWSIRNISIFIAYGPTEATCTVMAGVVQHDPITNTYFPTRLGQVTPGTTILLADENMDAIHTLDTEGEILISGKCLAAGYWSDEKLTSEKFIMYQGQQTYRTGDQGRWVTSLDGTRTLEFCGRRDRSIKIRGFLVNLDYDVDAAILQLEPSLTAAFSIFSSGRLLTAVAPAWVNTSSLLDRWKDIAPAYMVPDCLLALDEMPMVNGKLDQRSLTVQLTSLYPSKQRNETILSSSSSFEQILLQSLSEVINVPPSRIDLMASPVSQGLHSLGAAKLSLLCRQNAFVVTISDILLSASVRELINCGKEVSAKPTCSPGLEELGLLGVETVVTPLQKSLILETIDDNMMNYIQHLSYYTTSDIPKLKVAWRTVCLAEPIFRTSFNFDGYLQGSPGPTQTIIDSASFVWEEIMVQNQQEIDSALIEIIPKTNLSSSFLVLHHHPNSCCQNESIIVWTIHHALVDGFSASLIFEKVDAVLKGEAFNVSLPFTVAASEILQDQKAHREMGQAYWEKQSQHSEKAEGDFTLLTVPSEAGKSGSGHIVTPAHIPGNIVAFAQRMNVTPAAVYYAAWALLLCSYTNSDTVIFGAVFSGRNMTTAWANSMVGPMIRTLPMIVPIDRSEPSKHFVEKIYKSIVSLSSIHEPEVPGNLPSFSSIISVQGEGMKVETSSVKPLRPSIYNIKSSLPVNLVIESNQSINLFYHQSRLSRQDAQDIGCIYTSLLGALVHTERTVQQCLDNKLPPSMRQSLLEMGNINSQCSKIDCSTQTISDLFDASVQSNHMRVALKKGDDSLTYATLGDYVDNVAKAIELYTDAGNVVAVLADRSINWIIGMFAALQADTIYCPIDASNSLKYQQQLLDDSGANLLLVTGVSKLKTYQHVKQPLIDVSQAIRNGIKSEEAQRRKPDRNSLAYLCYTSGSTGKPKGVLCRHNSVVALYSSPWPKPSTTGLCVAQMMSPGFDGCILEIFWALFYGGIICLRDQDNDPFSHLHKADAAFLTPSVAAELDPAELPDLKTVHFAGEPVPMALVDRWAKGRQVYNLYGPTETTMIVCHSLLLPGLPVSLGAPLPSARVYILNSRLELQPPFTVGYIFIAGIQVAQGYHGRQDITEKEITADPFCPWSTEERMYSSGDLGFWDRQGRLHCCGRNDRQVKLRGFRTNLDDISRVASKRMPAIRKAFATAQNGSVILWVEPSSIDSEALEKSLQAVLPPHCIPRKVNVMQALPMTPNGKIDGKALVSKFLNSNVCQAIDESCLTPLEKSIAGLWRELLSLDASMVLTSASEFTSLGGHSVLQLALSARIKKSLGLAVAVRDIVSASTLGELANLIEKSISLQTSSRKPSKRSLPPERLGLRIASSAEADWAYRYFHSESQSTFNVPFVANLETIDVVRLFSSVQTVLNRHRILRSRFKPQGHQFARYISEEPNTVGFVSTFDLESFINAPFNISEENPVRAVMTPSVLAISISHIVCDLTALEILLNEVASLYHGKTLKPLDYEYFDSELWKAPPDQATLHFWSNYLGNRCYKRSVKNARIKSYRGTSVIDTVPLTSYARLRDLINESHVTLHQFGLTVVGITLHILSGTDDVILGSPYMNRPSYEEMNVVGLFLQPLPVRVHLDRDDESSIELLKRVQRSSQSALSHMIPWSSLMSYLGFPFPSSSQHLFDCVVTFHDNRYKGGELLALEGVNSQSVWTQGSKFTCLFEWQATAEYLELRLEYDTDLFNQKVFAVVQKMVLGCFRQLLDPHNTLRDIRSQMINLLRVLCMQQGLEMAEVQSLAAAYLCGAFKGSLPDDPSKATTSSE